MNQAHRKLSVSFAILLIAAGCGGGSGGSSDSGAPVVLQGTLTQSDQAATQRAIGPRLAHGANERIADVEVCSLGACSRTDFEGRWGYAVDYMPDEIAFTIRGHGIDDTVTVAVVPGANDVTIDFEREGIAVVARSVVVDGAQILQEDSGAPDVTF